MVTIFLHHGGRTEQVTSLDRGWLNPAAGVCLWVDLAAPSTPESLMLSQTFGFHPLSVEDAMSARQYPKVEAYDGYLYIILHGIAFQPETPSAAGVPCFATQDVDFFLGRNFLVTVHDGRSATINELREHAVRNHKILSDGPVVLFHRIVDTMVDHYRPEIDKLEDRLDEIEKQVFEHPPRDLVRRILATKRDVSSIRRIITPQRDVVARLARREFVDISTEMSFRFRDVYDHLQRITDDSLIYQERITGILEAHLSNVSNRLNEVMKVLTVVATIFMPLTLLSGLYGMNVPLPRFPGSDTAQFWWISGVMLAVVVGMLVMFRRRRWV